MSTGSKKRSWERQERHYCQYCNVWMGSDRQSILLHENGQKHKAAVDRYMQDKRASKVEQEKAASLIQKSLAQMEAAAQQSHATDAVYYGGHHHAPRLHHVLSAAGVYHNNAPYPPFAVPSGSAVAQPTAIPSLVVPPPPPPISPQPPPSHHPAPAAVATKDEKRQWEDRKKHRQEDNERKRKERKRANDGEGGDESDDDANDRDGGASGPSLVAKQIKLDTSFGHYVSPVDPTQVWLEGEAFGERLVEEDMPVQLWTGSVLATSAEKRLLDRDSYWKDALILAVRKQRSTTATTVVEVDSNDGNAVSVTTTVVVDLAYLESADAEQETVVRSVPLSRIRILLGNPKDERIPETLEEARIIALGGMEDESAAHGGTPSAVDEATGLSSWTTVSVKKTTVRQEEREERDRERQKRREAALAAQKELKRAEERKMEEAKVSNADDSALGAYDVWNRGEKEGYKGVDIHAEAKVDVHELGKKLVENGTKVQFKKPAFKSKATSKQNRRTTTADD